MSVFSLLHVHFSKSVFLKNIYIFVLSDVPEFHALVGNEAADELQSSRNNPARASLALKKCFSRMMNCEKKVFVDQLNMLVKRVSEEGKILKCHFLAVLYLVPCET